MAGKSLQEAGLCICFASHRQQQLSLNQQTRNVCSLSRLHAVVADAVRSSFGDSLLCSHSHSAFCLGPLVTRKHPSLLPLCRRVQPEHPFGTCFKSAPCHWLLNSEGPLVPPATWMRTTADPGESCALIWARGPSASPPTVSSVRVTCASPQRRACGAGFGVLSCVHALQTCLVLCRGCWETTCGSRGLYPSWPST